MQKNWIWSVAKALEGLGLVAVLVGLVLSVQYGMQDEGMRSMRFKSPPFSVVRPICFWPVRRLAKPSM